MGQSWIQIQPDVSAKGGRNIKQCWGWGLGGMGGGEEVEWSLPQALFPFLVLVFPDSAEKE